jgi:hypothetical protein
MSNPKTDYVRRQGQIRSHTCHWPGCEAQVPPALWGCRAHWFALPKPIRDRIWQTFRPGQEKTLTPSADYIAAARAAQAWIAQRHPPKTDTEQGELI